MKRIEKSKLDELICARTEAFIAEGKIGCAEILVNQCGKRVFHRTFGKDTASGEKLKPGKIYRAASMTKPINAAAFLKMSEEYGVQLEAPLACFLPEYRCMNIGHVEEGKVIVDRPAVNPLFVYQLLCHVNGIGVDPFCGIVFPQWKSTQDTCSFYAVQPLAFEPGTKQSYSPTAAFDVAAAILERQTGCGFAEYVRENVTAPLSMQNTTFSPTREQWKDIVGMHDRLPDGRSTTGKTTEGCVFSDIPPEACAAGAGLATTAEDYVRFAEMLLNNGIDENGKRILSENSVKLMQTPHVPVEIMNGSQRWGLGVRVITSAQYAHHLPVGSYGWSGAYGTHFWVDPENRITAVYMKNSLFDGGSGSYSSACFEEDVMDSLK